MFHTERLEVTVRSSEWVKAVVALKFYCGTSRISDTNSPVARQPLPTGGSVGDLATHRLTRH